MFRNLNTKMDHPPQPKVYNWDEIFVKERVYLELDERGLPWAVFRDNCYTWEYSEETNAPGIGHWDSYENGVCLQETIGL